MYFQLVDNQALSTQGQPDVCQPAPPYHEGVPAAEELADVGPGRRAVGALRSLEVLLLRVVYAASSVRKTRFQVESKIILH